MSTVSVTNLKHGSSASNNLVLDANGNVTAAGTVAMATPFAMRNKIINGAMEIDQRNAGASVTPTAAAYTLDRWAIDVSQASKLSVQQNAGSVTPPSGFKNYIGITSLSAYSIAAGDYFAIQQAIEGVNCVDLAFGTSSASTVTLSFWVRSSLTGTFGGSLRNSAANRSYPFSYTISASNTWERKTITIIGDTTGTWLTTNGVGVNVWFGLGVGTTFSGTAGSWAGANYASATGAVSVVGTNGASFYLTGVQLEVGSVATPFERRLYGQELLLAQRYCQTVKQGVGVWTQTTLAQINVPYFVQMRAAPSVTQTATITATDYTAADRTQSSTSISILNGNDQYGTTINLGNFTGFTIGTVAGIRNYTGTGVILFSAEL